MNAKNETTTAALRYMQNTKTMLTSPEAIERLSMVAAGHLSPQRMLRLVAVAAMKTPKLYDVHPLSMLGALMSAASLGLEPNTPNGHCFLIPFENRRQNRVDVELVIGYKGMIQLALNSGIVQSIRANIHYSDDEFWDWEEGSNAQLRHRPGAQEGEMLHAYAIAKGRNDYEAWVVLPWSHILKVRNGSSNWKSAVQYNKTASNPWSTSPAAMAKKTAIRNLFNMLPKASEMILMATDLEAGRGHDFAKLALNPEMAQDGSYISADIEEAEAQAEDARRDEPDPAPAQKPARRAKADMTKAYADPSPERKREEQPEQKAQATPEQSARADAAEPSRDTGGGAGEQDYSQHPVYQEILMVLADGIPVETIRVGMDASISALKMTDPGAHRAIEALLEQADSVSVQTDDGDDGFEEA